MPSNNKVEQERTSLITNKNSLSLSNLVEQKNSHILKTHSEESDSFSNEHLEATDSFGVGQKAVYPCHGVGTIEKIQACNVGGSNQDFYVIKIHSTGAKVMVPTGSAKTIGLRSVISVSEVEKVYSIFQLPSKKSNATWNRRFRKLNDLLNTGDLEKVAEVLNELATLSQTKDLSFGERKMLERARGMFVSEVSVALNKDESDVQHDLNKRLFQL